MDIKAINSFSPYTVGQTGNYKLLSVPLNVSGTIICISKKMYMLYFLNMHKKCHQNRSSRLGTFSEVQMYIRQEELYIQR